MMSVPIDLWDKFLHFVSFGVWSAGYYILAHLFREDEAIKAFKYSVIYGASFGALIEILQFLLPLNRSFEFADFIADLLGAIIITFIIKELIRTLKSSLQFKKSRN